MDFPVMSFQALKQYKNYLEGPTFKYSNRLGTSKLKNYLWMPELKRTVDLNV